MINWVDKYSLEFCDSRKGGGNPNSAPVTLTGIRDTL
jgi:hypothetical protein